MSSVLIYPKGNGNRRRVEIRFGSSNLAEVCNCSASIDQRWGEDVGDAIRERLCLLAAVPSLELVREFAGFLMEPVSLDKNGSFAIALVPSWKLLIAPDHQPVPFVRDRELDCKKVEKLVIVEVHSSER